MPKKPIDHYEHPDKLPNNPTQELSGFAEDEENAPTRYPRDTALDPQLVWKGKDQQNDTDLEVQAVPIYTQEHIQPQAIIETSAPKSGRNQTNSKCFLKGSIFTGADEPYKQLQRALNSEIDAGVWEALYRKESLPFAKPETGKIAVKVINHYGDEVMKEYRV